MTRYLKRAATPLAVTLAVVAAAGLYFVPGGASAHHLCPNTGSPFGPFQIQTYEAADYHDLYASTFELAAFNALFPEHSGFTTPDLDTGARSAGSTQPADPYIPPVLLKSIGFLESGWAQASYDPLVQYGEVGPVLASHDCGYGIMQITTGMQNISGVPNLDQAMIGTHYAFNVARGARILAEKWNLSPEQRPIVGSRNPELIEDWYYSIWGYNGFAFSNHPLNPAYSPTRVAYSCAPSGDGFGHDRTQYPYQELVMGCSERPPVRASEQLWSPQEVHLPELTNPIFANPLKLENWNPCAYSLNCAAMDIPTPNTFHEDATVLNVTREEVLGEPILNLSSSGANVALPPGTPSSALSFKVANGGSGVLGFQATSNAAWLKATPAAGVALGADLGKTDGTVSLALTPGSLPVGSYSGKITVTSLYATNAPKTYTVNLTVGQPTPAPTPVPTPTPAPTLAPSGKWGDADCSKTAPDPVDSLLTLRYDAGLSANTFPCPPIGTVMVFVEEFIWGDIDCNGRVDPVDSLKILRYDSGEAISKAPGCPALNSGIVFPG